MTFAGHLVLPIWVQVTIGWTCNAHAADKERTKNYGGEYAEKLSSGRPKIK